MGIEIERKFLLKNDAWREQVTATVQIQQAYLNKDDGYSVRIRVENESANINIKSNTVGRQRHEYEYPVPINDAQEMLENLPDCIDKHRHLVNASGLVWEIDEFKGLNQGLVVAEVELDTVDQEITLPDWCGREVTEDERYYNVCLSILPYSLWVAHIEISISDQKLRAFNEQGNCVFDYSISSALKGFGESKDSGCTPRGLHQIRAKIGTQQPQGTVFVSRRPSGEIWSNQLASQHPDRDWILSRILWLSGCEKGKNRLGQVDSMQRYIYIHGTPDVEAMGVPLSHGCIRMRNTDVIELFEHVFVGTTVMINE